MNDTASRITRRLYLTPADQGRPLTLEQFQSAGSREGYHYELIDGRLEVSPLPDLPHDDLSDWLKDKLRLYQRLHPRRIARVKGPVRVFVPDVPRVTAPEPDVAAYRKYLSRRPLKKRRWQLVSPFLVAEIVSDDTVQKDFVRNLELYEMVPSIQEYWIIDPRHDPDRPTMTVYRKRGGKWHKPIHVAAGETYRTPLLPGFALVLDPHR